MSATTFKKVIEMRNDSGREIEFDAVGFFFDIGQVRDVSGFPSARFRIDEELLTAIDAGDITVRGNDENDDIVDLPPDQGLTYIANDITLAYLTNISDTQTNAEQAEAKVDRLGERVVQALQQFDERLDTLEAQVADLTARVEALEADD